MTEWLATERAKVGSNGAAAKGCVRHSNDRERLIARARKYMEKVEPAVSGRHGHDATFRVACRLVEFGLTQAEAGPLLKEYSDRCNPPWSDKDQAQAGRGVRQDPSRPEVRGRARDGHAPKQGDDGHCSAAGEKPRTSSAKPTPAHVLGPFTIRPGPARRTASGAVKVQVAAFRGGSVAYDFVLSASPFAWRQHGEVLQQLADPEPFDKGAVPKIFAEIIAEAGRRADAPAPAAADGPTVESVVKALAGPRWHLTARIKKGAAWSEVRGCEVSQSEFVGGADEELMAAAAQALDAPRGADGRVARRELLQMIKAELQVQWASLLRSLPPMGDADMGAGTAAGRAFREALVRLWTAATTMECPKKADGEEAERIVDAGQPD